MKASLQNYLDSTRPHLKDMAIITLAVLLFFAFFYFYQPSYVEYKHQGSDAKEYSKLYEYFKTGEAASVYNLPYSNRLLVPYIASRIPGLSAAHAFLLIHLSSALAFMLLFYYIRILLGIDKSLFYLVMLWFLLHPSGIIRFSIYNPFNIDPMGHVFHALLIIIFMKRRFNWLILIAPFAVAQKESFNALVLLLLIYAIYINRSEGKKTIPLAPIFISLILGITVQSMVHAYLFPPPPNGSYIPYRAFVRSAKFFNEPHFVMRILASLFAAFGPILIITAQNIGRFRDSFSDALNRNFFLIYSLFFVFICIAAGTDTTRIAIYGGAFTLMFAMSIMNGLRMKYTLQVFLLSLPLLRLLIVLPRPILNDLGRITNEDRAYGFTSMFPEMSTMALAVSWLVYMMILYYLASLLKKR